MQTMSSTNSLPPLPLTEKQVPRLVSYGPHGPLGVRNSPEYTSEDLRNHSLQFVRQYAGGEHPHPVHQYHPKMKSVNRIVGVIDGLDVIDFPPLPPLPSFPLTKHI